MADQAVLERETVDEQTEPSAEQKPRLYQRFAGLGVSITLPVPPDKVPEYWFD